ncbi:major facilitator superfamily MFS_1 [Desulfovibrio sp. X2]|uniref:MFS transporter n=1 Tax=Desulfovibrio sp. X2 TaxID=941449 RepID=UPI000358D432|nr:MFS transporter [Desulfovibrio sp. X2]EPR41927.1 major facilitator superfamily MFS_1 [Desulfovibrio sp. X2]
MRDSRRMYIFLLLLTVASFLGLQGWRTLLNNFAVDVAHIDGMGIGIIQSVREIPGFLAMFMVYLLLLVSEHRLAALSMIVVGLGVGLTGFFPSFLGLVVTTIVMSTGFHCYETMNQSLTLQYFDRGTAPLVLGRMRSVGALTNIAVGGVIWLAASHLDYPEMYAWIGGVVVLLGIICLLFDPSRKDLPVQRKKMIFRRRYWLYYVLTLLAGARRQIFVAFAVFLLVQHFDFSVREVTILFICNNVINWFLNPLIGKAINRYGERVLLTAEYAVMVVVFLTYAYTTSKYVAAGMYVVDNIFFNFAIAIRTFLQKIADREDIAPSSTMGFTINHITAVAVPFLGGLAWMADYRFVFIAAAVLAGCSVVASQFVTGQLRLADERAERAAERAAAGA